MTYRKYYFTAKQWATALAKIQLISDDSEPQWSDKVSAVYAWHPVKTEATYDEEGNVTTEAVIDTKWCVDIIWAGEPLKTSFTSYEVWPDPCGQHIFAGWESAYTDELYIKYPNRKPDETIEP